jgi:hypothetical protein
LQPQNDRRICFGSESVRYTIRSRFERYISYFVFAFIKYKE